MAGSRTEVKGFVYEWLDQLDNDQLKQIRGLFNAVLETETVIGFPEPLRDDEGHEFFEGLRLDLQLKRKQLLLVQGPEKQVVGMVLLSQNSQPNCRHMAELTKCIVHPTYRGQRILEEGIKVLAARCKEIGVDMLVMDVRKGSRAEKLWRLLGFVPFGELADYARVNGQQEAGLFMSVPVEQFGRRQ